MLARCWNDHVWSVENNDDDDDVFVVIDDAMTWYKSRINILSVVIVDGWNNDNAIPNVSDPIS